MKKSLPYLLLVLLVVVAGVILYYLNSGKEFDKRTSFNKKSTAPYGCSILYNSLPILFPQASISNNNKKINDWYYGKSDLQKNTLYIIVTKQFYPSESQLTILRKIVTAGNYVMIVTPIMNNEAESFFDLQQQNGYTLTEFDKFNPKDSVHLLKPPFKSDTSFTYPGFDGSGYFFNYDKEKFLVAATNDKFKSIFLKVNDGEGSFLLHSNPFLFSNYFLLYKNNHQYLENVFALVPPTVKNIVWDEYFMSKTNTDDEYNSQKQNSKLSVLLSNPSFAWAFYLTIALLAIYLLLHVKRMFNIVPVIQKPKNESLDFIQTIGKLYFEKQDHYNLAAKMALYFLEHVRSKYYLNTSKLNIDFVQKLSGKSGYDEELTKQLVNSVIDIQNANQFSETDIAYYYKQFKHFYKNTA